MFKQIAAAVALAGCCAANASAQAVAGPIDSLSVTAILETIAREAADGRSAAGVATATSISQARMSSWRADSLLHGLRDIALNGSTPDVRAVAAGTIAASGTQRGQGTLLLEVFDGAHDAHTRAVILNALGSVPDTQLRRDVIVRAIGLNGDRGSEFLVAVAAFTALKMGSDGVALLQRALADGVVTDERARAIIELAITSSMTNRGR